MTEKTKSLIRKAILTAALFMIAHYGGKAPVGEHVGPDGYFGGGTVLCIIDTGEEVHSTKSRKAGFNYEMLKKFAEAEKFPIKIAEAEEGENYLDSLAAGSIDILVKTATDSVDNPEIRKTRVIGRDCVWYLRTDRMAEIKDINVWFSSICGTKEYQNLINRFYSNYDPFKRIERGIVSSRLSPYDELIKKHADILGWDWRMLAALIYKESKFSIMARSSRGAFGLMQVIPNTASYYGITDLFDPQQNITAGCRHIARIQTNFSGEEFTEAECINFTLASYNAGEGRIADCRRVADAKGLDSTKWEEIVKIIPEMRRYNIEDNDTVRVGGFRGGETVSFVSRIHEIYSAFCEICPQQAHR